MTARVTVTMHGETFAYDVQDATVTTRQPVREVPCPDQPPCRFVHREIVGKPRLRITGRNPKWVDL